MDQFRIALAQLEPQLFNKASNLVKAEQFIRRAALQEADAILFPELYLTGYSLGSRALEIAEPYDGPSIGRVAELAKRYSLVVMMGFAELSPNGKGAYDACFVVDGQGRLAGIYRKTHLYQAETHWFLPGEGPCLLDFGLGPVGFLICYDLEFPETARDLALRGAKWIATSTGNMTPNQHLQNIVVQTRAAENRLWIALANRVGCEGELNFFGGSAVSDPFGTLEIQAGQGEMLLFADIDLNRANQARLNADYLADRRPELYRRLTD
jgi:predicted amidohydrolase